MTPMAMQLTDEESVLRIVEILPSRTPLAISLDPLCLEVGAERIRISAGDWVIRDEQGRLMRGTAVTGEPADELTALRRVHAAAVAAEREMSGMSPAHEELVQALASAAHLPATTA